MTLFWVTHAMPHWTNFGVYTWSVGKKTCNMWHTFCKKKSNCPGWNNIMLFSFSVNRHLTSCILPKKTTVNPVTKKSMECVVSKELSNNPQELGLHKSRLRIGSQVPMFQMAWSQSKPRYYLPGRYPRPMNQLKLLCFHWCTYCCSLDMRRSCVTWRFINTT